MNNGLVLILGARSDIAIALTHCFAKSGYDIQLAARNAENLNKNKHDLELRYEIKVTLCEFDVLNFSEYDLFLERLPAMPDIVISAVGYMGEQKESEKDLLSTTKVFRSNFEGPSNIFSKFANIFELRGSGTLVGISSVAGNRGRQKNYIYGSAKAGFTTFLSGLRNRLSGKGVHVITVLPGFVATKMTSGLNLPDKLTAKPVDVAKAIFVAVKKKQNIIYVKPIWRIIMIIVRIIPEWIFKKTNI